MRDAPAELGLDWQLPPLAVSFAPRRASQPCRARRSPSRPTATCTAVPRTHLPAVRRVRHRLQRRREEHPRPHLPVGRRATTARTCAPCTRCAASAPRAGRRLRGRATSCTTRPTRRHKTATAGCRCTGSPATGWCWRPARYGTTYLLLRNRTRLPRPEPRRSARRFCGNGDLLAFLLRRHRPGGRRRPAPHRGQPRTGHHQRDPASATRSTGRATGRGYYIEDGGYPEFADWLVEAASCASQAAAARAVRAGPGCAGVLDASPTTDLSAEHRATCSGRARLSDSVAAAARHGPRRPRRRDAPARRPARGRLDDRRRQRGLLRPGARHDARHRPTCSAREFADNPLWWSQAGRSPCTRSGGAPMGRHVARGRLRPVRRGVRLPRPVRRATARLLPGPVGANPSLTIAALADRACDRILAEPARSAHRPADQVITLPEQGDGTRPAHRRAADRLDQRVVHRGDEGLRRPRRDGPGDRRGARARQLGQRLMFHLTITAEDVDRVRRRPAAPGTATGLGRVRRCSAAGCRSSGAGSTCSPARARPDSRRMLYRLHFTDAGGNPLTLVGHKDVHDDPGATCGGTPRRCSSRCSPDTSPPAAAEDGARWSPRVSSRSTCPTSSGSSRPSAPRAPDRRTAMEEFGRLFLGQLWDVYGPALSGSSR